MPRPLALPCRDISRNSLTGSLPPEWGALGSLVSLDVSSNYLSGGLPAVWEALASLQQLRLSSNNLAVRWASGGKPGAGGTPVLKPGRHAVASCVESASANLHPLRVVEYMAHVPPLP